MRLQSLCLLAGLVFGPSPVCSTSSSSNESHRYWATNREIPICVSSCWENSKYVSSCSDDHSCLCDDAQFQGAVLQCLYSQCQTTQFGSALHFTMAQCFEEDSQATQTLPALVRHQALRKRQFSSIHVSASGSASASTVHSVAHRQLSVSASANARPTQSAAYASVRSHATPIATPTVLFSGPNATSFNATNAGNVSGSDGQHTF